MALAAVRPAVATDVDEIVRIQALTWRAAFADVVPATALDQLDGPEARQAWAAAVTAGDGYHVFLATEGEWTVGFCAAACYSGEGGTIAEVSALLVEPRWGRRGHGGRLFAAAAAALRAAGAERGIAWVPEADTVSQRFYHQAGWAPDGAARVLDTGDGTLRELRLAGPLTLELQD